MRVIFEKVEGEHFFEAILEDQDIHNIVHNDGALGDFLFEMEGVQSLNVFLRKEKRSDLCQWSKEKQQSPEKDLHPISKKKLPRENPRSRASRSLIQKRVGGKRLLKKVRNNE
jgi:hypothetical protein